MIKADRLCVVSFWSEIVRGGRRIVKIRPVTARQQRNEYWGFPASSRVQKLGNAQKFGVQLGSLREEEDGTLNAARWMKDGSELQKFADLRQAEDWIAEADRWGALQIAEPKTRRSPRRL